MQPRVNQTITGHFWCPVLPPIAPHRPIYRGSGFWSSFCVFFERFFASLLANFSLQSRVSIPKMSSWDSSQTKNFANSAFFLRKWQDIALSCIIFAGIASAGATKFARWNWRITFFQIGAGPVRGQRMTDVEPINWHNHARDFSHRVHHRRSGAVCVSVHCANISIVGTMLLKNALYCKFSSERFANVHIFSYLCSIFPERDRQMT